MRPIRFRLLVTRIAAPVSNSFFPLVLAFSVLTLIGCQPTNRPASDTGPTSGPESSDLHKNASPALRIVDRYPDQPEISSVALSRETTADQTAGKFVSLDASETGISFENIWQPSPETMAAFGTSYIASGVAAGDIDNDGRPDIYLTRQQDGGRLYRNLGGMKFEDITTAAGIDPAGMWSVGAAMVDLTNDGNLDLYVYGYGCPNRLYVNDGAGKFTGAGGAVWTEL